ncbi:hypothetical protein AB0D32_31290 [Micromonospora sp. NPDC048170]
MRAENHDALPAAELIAATAAAVPAVQRQLHAELLATDEPV